MVKIDKFNEFGIENNTLYVFDFDDTLMVTPRYEDIAIKFLNENLTVKDLLDRAVKRIGITKDKLKVQDRRIFVDDPNKIYKEEKDWIRKGNRLYLVQPDAFSYLDESLPTKLKELASLYKSVEDKVRWAVELDNRLDILMERGYVSEVTKMRFRVRQLTGLESIESRIDELI